MISRVPTLAPRALVPLDHRSKNKRLCLSGFTAEFASMRMPEMAARLSISIPELFSPAHDRRREELWGTLGPTLRYLLLVETKKARLIGQSARR